MGDRVRFSAWGFPSPDSDYDCRFSFVRPADAYLSPWRPRDVIETPLDAVLDVNGWDLIKAVRLAAVGNATVLEWLRSPLVYQGESDFRDELLALCEQVADPGAVRRHYLHVGLSQWTRSGAAQGQHCRLKGIFYVLRPAAALHWMRLHDKATPPMRLQALLDESPPPAPVREATQRLIELKGRTRELGVGPVPEVLRDFISDEFTLAAAADDHRGRAAEQRATATAAFTSLLTRWAPGNVE